MSKTETTRSLTEIRASLTDSELRRIKRMVLGYGNFKATAKKADVHVETLRGVLARGYGETETVNKIRKVVTE